MRRLVGSLCLLILVGFTVAIARQQPGYIYRILFGVEYGRDVAGEGMEGASRQPRNCIPFMYLLLHGLGMRIRS